LTLLLACAGPDDSGPQCEKETYWIDADKDGFGDPAKPHESCALAAGLAANPEDCDDTRPEVRPGAPEDDCSDPVDYNCDGSVGYADYDGDGAAACEDCDDTNPLAYPDADEICNDVDDDCDGLVDYFAVDETTWYEDADNDGYGIAFGEQLVQCDPEPGFADNDQDCDDNDATIHPDADEYCNGVDDDCDGDLDDDAVDAPAWFEDLDLDGYGAGSAVWDCKQPSGFVGTDTDCDDDDDTQFPGADEVCNDEDDDCDGAIDDGHRVPSDYSSIQDAIDDVEDASLICVASGTWSEDLEYTGKAVRVHGTEGSDRTFLDGSGGGSVVTLDADGELVGFTVSGGEADYGAGIYVDAEKPTLSDLVITDNRCNEQYCYGTGIYLVNSSATLADVRITDNVADAEGVWGVGLTAEDSRLDATNVWISGNEATGSNYVAGVGLALSGSDNSVFDGLVVAGNTGAANSLYAVGIWVYGGASPALFNASVVDNAGTATGTGYGEGVTAYSAAKPSATNVDVSGHTTGWASYFSSSLSVRYSNAWNQTDFSGASDPGGTAGNIMAKPQYTDTSSSDPGAWDLSLDTGSDLIDAGDPSRTDTDGSTSDIGAYGGPYGDW